MYWHKQSALRFSLALAGLLLLSLVSLAFWQNPGWKGAGSAPFFPLAPLASFPQPERMPSPKNLTSSDVLIYGDALSDAWMNWSWNTTVNPNNASPTQGGSSASLAVTYNQGWAGLKLHTNTPIATTGYTSLRFWLHGGTSGGQVVRVSPDDGNAAYQVTAQANTWTLVEAPLSELGSPASLSDLVWQESSGQAQATLYLDEIVLVAQSGPPPPTPLPGLGPALSVNTAAGRHAISPFIYGMNFAQEDLAAELRLPVRRWGGNATTRYNWQIDVFNTGSDWFFENITNQNTDLTSLPNGSSTDLFVSQDQRTGSATLLTVPLIGWTPNRRLADHPYDCGFKVSRYGTQQQTDAWDADCGNGKNQAGANLTGNNPADTSLAIGPEFVSAWIEHLVARFGSAAQGGVAFYNLDNEPMLWPYTHRDVHPQMTTYDEMRDRTFAYAAAVKSADSTAQTLGPVVWGWCAYFYSALDGCQPGPDRQAHGSTDFIPWYLQQMSAYQQQHGLRILDYLDVHYYPQSNVALSTAGNADMQARRLRSTRSLWDPGYQDESWIGKEVALLPRMHAWVEANYPGTKLALTEYNFGGLEHINGALAQADVLGIFGREGLDLAALWDPPTLNQPGAFAFRMYRNYNGQGGAFGETAVQAASADQAKVAVYSALRTGDGALTILLINKTGEALTSSLAISGNFIRPAQAQVYRYSTADLSAILRQPDLDLDQSQVTLPASSITLLVLIPEDSIPGSLYFPKVDKP